MAVASLRVIDGPVEPGLARHDRRRRHRVFFGGDALRSPGASAPDRLAAYGGDPRSPRPAKSYPLGETTVEAVRGVTLEVAAGEFVALMGPSGSGKSTLLQLLGGLDRPTSGEVILEGETISQLSDEQATRLRRDRTGFVFQSFNLIPLLDVTENMALPFTIAGADPTRGDIAGPDRATSSSSST